MINPNYRPAPMLAGGEGKRLQEKVWREIVQVLRKDVPELNGVKI